MNCHHILTKIKEKLVIHLFQLYNLLKFMRNNMDVRSLNMNKDNVVDIIANVYKTNYINRTNYKKYLYSQYLYFFNDRLTIILKKKIMNQHPNKESSFIIFKHTHEHLLFKFCYFSKQQMILSENKIADVFHTNNLFFVK